MPLTLYLSPSQSVRSFFRKNMDTCLEWLSHVRSYIVSIAIHAGMPAVAVRHGFAALKDFTKHSNQYKTVSSLSLSLSLSLSVF